MKEEEGSAATGLPMYNCEKSSAVQYQQLKKTLIEDFGVIRDEIYIKIKV